jgi:hypothetical protein
MWARPFWIDGETLLEEARLRERRGEGAVIDDGRPPARWRPADLWPDDRAAGVD